jgi:hypothetical protein
MTTAIHAQTTPPAIGDTWDKFRCWKCRRVLFFFDDGQSARIDKIRRAITRLDGLAASGAITVAERDEMVVAYKYERKIEIKCTLTSCKAKNYLMESVR